MTYKNPIRSSVMMNADKEIRDDLLNEELGLDLETLLGLREYYVKTKDALGAVDVVVDRLKEKTSIVEDDFSAVLTNVNVAAILMPESRTSFNAFRRRLWDEIRVKYGSTNGFLKRLGLVNGDLGRARKIHGSNLSYSRDDVRKNLKIPEKLTAREYVWLGLLYQDGLDRRETLLELKATKQEHEFYETGLPILVRKMFNVYLVPSGEDKTRFNPLRGKKYTYKDMNASITSEAITSFTRNILGYKYKKVFEIPKKREYAYGLLVGLLIRSTIYWKNTGFNLRFSGCNEKFLLKIKGLTNKFDCNSSRVFPSRDGRFNLEYSIAQVRKLTYANEKPIEKDIPQKGFFINPYHIKKIESKSS